MLALIVASNAFQAPYIVSKNGLPGDVGFDPLKLSTYDLNIMSATKKKRTSEEILNDYREAELKHGRLAMLASLAYPLQEKLNPIVSSTLNLPNLLEKTGGLSPSLLNGGLDQGRIPTFLFGVAVAIAMLEVRGMELTSNNPARLPGDYELRLTSTKPGDDEFTKLQAGEIWNSRIAMIAMLGYVVQEALTKVPVANTLF